MAHKRPHEYAFRVDDDNSMVVETRESIFRNPQYYPQPSTPASPPTPFVPGQWKPRENAFAASASDSTDDAAPPAPRSRLFTIGSWVVTRFLPGLALLPFHLARRFLRPQTIRVEHITREDGANKRRYIDAGTPDRPYTPTRSSKTRATKTRTPDSDIAAQKAAVTKSLGNAICYAPNSATAPGTSAHEREVRPLLSPDAPLIGLAAKKHGDGIDMAQPQSYAEFADSRRGRPLVYSDESLEELDDVDGPSMNPEDSDDDDSSFFRNAITGTPPMPPNASMTDPVPTSSSLRPSPTHKLLGDSPVGLKKQSPVALTKQSSVASMKQSSVKVDKNKSTSILSHDWLHRKPSLFSPRRDVLRNIDQGRVNKATLKTSAPSSMAYLRAPAAPGIAQGGRTYGSHLFNRTPTRHAWPAYMYGAGAGAGTGWPISTGKARGVQALGSSRPKALAPLTPRMMNIPRREVITRPSDHLKLIPKVKKRVSDRKSPYCEDDDPLFGSLLPDLPAYPSLANASQPAVSYDPTNPWSNPSEPLWERLAARAAAQPDLDREREARANTIPETPAYYPPPLYPPSSFNPVFRETVDQDLSTLSDAPEIVHTPEVALAMEQGRQVQVKQVQFNETVHVHEFYNDPLTDVTPRSQRNFFSPVPNGGGGASDITSSDQNPQVQKSSEAQHDQVGVEASGATHSQPVATSSDTAAKDKTDIQNAKSRSDLTDEEKKAIEESEWSDDSYLDLVEAFEKEGMIADDRPYDRNGNVLPRPSAQAQAQAQPPSQGPSQGPAPQVQPMLPVRDLVVPVSQQEEDELNSIADAVRRTNQPRQDHVGGSRISVHDFATLLSDHFDGSDSKWLNDGIVNEYLRILTQHFKDKDGWKKQPKKKTSEGPAPRIHAFNSQWLDSESIQSWTDSFSLGGTKYLEAELLLYPICDRDHWRLIAVKPQDRSVEYFDSLGQNGAKYIKKILFLIQKTIGPEAWAEKPFTSSGSSGNQRSARQLNGSDCGVFTVLNALALLRGVKHSRVVVSDGMLDARKRIAMTLLAKKPTTEFS